MNPRFEDLSEIWLAVWVTTGVAGNWDTCRLLYRNTSSGSRKGNAEK